LQLPNIIQGIMLTINFKKVEYYLTY